MIDRNSLHDDIIQIIAPALHVDECRLKGEGEIKTAEEFNYIQYGWKKRYRDEPLFRARVQQIVAGLMVGIDRSLEKAVSNEVTRQLRILDNA